MGVSELSIGGFAAAVVALVWFLKEYQVRGLKRQNTDLTNEVLVLRAELAKQKAEVRKLEDKLQPFERVRGSGGRFTPRLVAKETEQCRASEIT